MFFFDSYWLSLKFRKICVYIDVVDDDDDFELIFLAQKCINPLSHTHTHTNKNWFIEIAHSVLRSYMTRNSLVWGILCVFSSDAHNTVDVIIDIHFQIESWLFFRLSSCSARAHAFQNSSDH